MQQRTRFDICLPFVVFLLCMTSIPGAIFALAWMTLGMMAIGHRGLDSFPVVMDDVRWRSGYRCACIWFYHIAWWPWYVRSEARRIVASVLRVFAPRSALAQNLGAQPHDPLADLRDAPPSAQSRRSR